MSQKKMEVGPQTEIVTFTLVFLFATGVAATEEFTKGENNRCSAVKTAWGINGLGTHMVPSSPVPGLDMASAD